MVIVQGRGSLGIGYSLDLRIQRMSSAPLLSHTLSQWSRKNEAAAVVGRSSAGKVAAAGG